MEPREPNHSNRNPEQNNTSNTSQEQNPSRQLFSSSIVNSNQHQLPEIQLPKGGGAIKGIDEKFEVNPVNGTNSVSIPLPVSPARNGFSPSLSVNYSSGGGNGVFGMGWNLSLPSIQRKTDKQLPKYQDAIDSDIYIMAGAEDLIPLLKESGGNWTVEETTSGAYQVRQYRPRIEGSWLRIERWTETSTGIIHWRVISTTNTVSIYGATANARIANPENPDTEIFQWLLSYSYDNMGNIMLYEYKEENLVGVDSTMYEKNRTTATVTNRYLKRVHYGNKDHYKHGDPLPLASKFLFETVLDYGEHDVVPTPQEIKPWTARKDAFSSFRSGFDIRTYRLCKRAMVFHKFEVPTDQPVDDLLVAAVEFKYEDYPDKDPSTPHLEGFTYLKEVNSRGYIYEDNTYKSDAMPPLRFYYQMHEWNTEIKELSEEALEHAPTGINNSGYTWTDLYGEGLSGILSEQGNGWYYKENLGGGNFSPATLLKEKPSLAGLNAGGLQLQDLDGSGEKQAVSWSGGLKGYFQLEDGEQWEAFQAFESVPNRNLFNDPNARFVDLDGDGRPDLLITNDNLFQWYESKGKKGFGQLNEVRMPWDEEDGPRIVFADQEQSIFLADMTGDGMTDIVRITNEGICYWANKGYGRFSAKISMANAPKFDHEEGFHPQYLQLADVDGSGTTDICYLRHNSIQIWMNHSGNSWSAAPQIIHSFPAIDNQTSISMVDLLGTGTSCIVWSSAAAKDEGRPLRYIDLTNSKKPHLLYQYENNMGKEVRFEYISSTHFYLADKKAGTPWATKLPFPMHVVQKTQVKDYIRNTVFVNQYSYHHGFYDRIEREFRGFGRVETLDTEDFEALKDIGGSNIIEEHYQVPIKTVSWYHTGASFKHEHLTTAYQKEYYQNPLVEQDLGEIELPNNLTDQAYHEAFRACKGLLLRQEVYSLDTDNPKHEHPYSAAESTYQVQQVQPHAGQPYASFIVVPVQSLTYAYERNPQDPRIAHNLVLKTNELGMPLETAQVIYPRLQAPSLPTLIANEQQKIHAVFSQITTTNDVGSTTPLSDAYRLRAACEEKMYELLGLPQSNTFLTVASLNDYIHNQATITAYENDYSSGIELRLTSHSKVEFLKDDLSGGLPFQQQEALGLPYKSYQLAYTKGLRDKLYVTGNGTDLLAGIGGMTLPQDAAYYEDAAGNWWLESGTTIWSALASSNFYLPQGVRDPLGIASFIEFDAYRLLPTRSEDALGNVMKVENDYRMLSPWLITDPNLNQSAVAFDALGIVVKSAVMGKNGEGDTLSDPTMAIEYTYKNWMNHKKPNYVYSRVREEHASTNLPVVWQESFVYSDGGGAAIMTKVQAKDGIAKYWDDNAKEVKETQQPVKRWIGNGRTIIDNKGNPIKQYEPYFSITHDYEDEAELVEMGVTPIMYYDAAGRNIKTVLPNKTFVKVEFDAWQTAEYDTNDTVKDSEWYNDLDALHPGFGAGPEPQNNAELRACWLALQHYNTPTRAHLDCLGRTIYAEGTDGTTASSVYTETDLAGRYSKIYDQIATEELKTTGSTTRGESSYALTNMLGQAVYNRTAVKGEGWSFTDALGRMVRIWDNWDSSNPQDKIQFRTEYDTLHRPLKTYVQRGNNPEICFAQTVYGESLPLATGQARNLRGQAYQSYDQSGLMTTSEVDFKGNPLGMSRQLVEDHIQNINWDASPALLSEVFETSTTYDALNRPKKTTLPDRSVVVPTYNKGGYVETLKVNILGLGTWVDFMKGQDYDAKGQRQYVKYGNGSITKYFYEGTTFRLKNLLTTVGNERLQDLHYTYDAVGNVTEIVDDAQSTYYYNNRAISPTKKYTYDALYRLTKATGREHVGGGSGVPTEEDLPHLQNLPHNNIQSAVSAYVQEYRYDTVGNILQMKHQSLGTSGGWTRDYKYYNDATNRLKETTVGGTTPTYTQYDAHGNMTKMPHLQALRWNFMDELRMVELNANDRAYYNYDASGQRVRKVVKVGNKRKERLYLGGVERYREYNANSVVTLERWTLQVEGIAQVDTLTIDNSSPVGNPEPLIRYQYKDHLGSSTVETNGQGQVISYEEYHPYGTTAYRAEKSGTDISLKRYRFTNKERDDETGLYYFGVRYYAAWLGRWTSSDPGGFVDGLNLYQYVQSNPVNGVDNKGYCTCPPDCPDPPCDKKEKYTYQWDTSTTPKDNSMNLGTDGGVSSTTAPIGPSPLGRREAGQTYSIVDDPCILCTIWIGLEDTVGNVVLTGIEIGVSDETEGSLLRLGLNRKGFDTSGLTDEQIGESFSLRKVGGEAEIIPQTSLLADFGDMVMGGLTLYGLRTPGPTGFLSTTRADAIAGLLNYLRRGKLVKEVEERFKRIKKFEDPAHTGKKPNQGMKDHEADAGAWFEVLADGKLVPSKHESIDYILEHGTINGKKVYNKTISHFGKPAKSPRTAEQFLPSVDSHFYDKAVDYYLIDIRAFDTAGKELIRNHVETFTSAPVGSKNYIPRNKVIYLVQEGFAF